MSIKISISELNQPQRDQIMNELQFCISKKQDRGPKKWIQPYNIEDGDIYLPYNYAYKMGFRPFSRDVYPLASMDFVGTLREYQLEVKSGAIKELNKKGSCILSLHVGWGKSIFSVFLATKLRFKTLILVNRLVLIKQWVELIEKCTTVTCQVLNPKTAMDPSYDIYIMNALSVEKMSKTTDFHLIGTLIIDELHLICAENLYKSMFHITPKYLIGLSATPTRPDGLDVLIDLYFGDYKIVKPLFKRHTVYAVQTGIVLKYELNWEGKIDWNSVLMNQAEHEERNQMIIKIIQKHPERYFLVLCKRISHGQRIVQLLEDEKEHVTDLLGTKKEFDTDARIVVATAQKCGVGFSHDKLNALIMAADVEEYFIQYLGRVFRTPTSEPIVFDLVDNLPVLKRHFQTRKRVYQTAGGVIQMIKMN